MISFFLLSLFNATGQIPFNNPVGLFYNGKDGYLTWTDHLQWQRSLDMSVYPNGTNDFENARDEMYNQGGGVLYYPAGTYYFSAIAIRL